MELRNLVRKIEDDDFAVDRIQGDSVIITRPIILGEKNSEWEGSPIFNREYLIDLIAIGLAYQVLNHSDLNAALNRANAFS
ncbi:hypothetical protein [Chromobacterium sphagni]|uniref:Uncharacterized protein n=1 Tax=Chromobacterium sphagni TaxID=1903179 RepID=A0ABX3CBG1_9NEIS|nr:hypothetical protein [Chromobacterium sphagni]OHX19630.1 hypothetical protein BI344_17275 [Chromobacterium sphagni]